MALINLRNALMTGKRLPYDAEVEFLESTGTQWIDTGIVPSLNTRIEATVQALASPTIVSTGATSYGVIGITYWNSPLSWATKFGNVGYKPAQGVASISTSVIYKLSLDKSNFTVNGTVYPVNATSVSASSSLRILYDVWNTGLDARVFNLKIYESAVLVRDFIPVRKGTVGYLYDRVSGKLFGNAGTGDFVLGSDVVPVEYIESHGTEYIKPDISVATNDSFALYVTGAFTGASSAMQLHGVNGGAYFGVQTNDNITVGGIDTNVPRDSAKHRWEMSATIGNSKTVSLNLDGTTYSRTRNNAEGHISLFALVFQSGGSPTYFCKFKMDAATIYKNGDLARKLLPVRVGQEGAMMDTLTRRIYRNAGTGAFTYGNDLKYPIPA